MTEEVKDASKQEGHDFGRQEIVESGGDRPEGSAEVERLDEADLEWLMLLAGGGQAYACDDGLSEDEATDFLGGGGEGVAEQQGRSAQVEFDFFVGGLVLPSHPV